jgi:hypothetical protein
MSSFFRVVVNWTGFNGGPGFTNLYFRTADAAQVTAADAENAALKVDSWIASIANHLPGAVSVKVDPTVTEINEETGAQIGFLGTSTWGQHPGGDGSGYSAASGACFNWYTAGVRNGRRIRGRTFIVPLGGTKYDSQGTLSSTTITSFQNATQTLLDNDSMSTLTVWSRPSAPGASDGEAWDVLTYTLPDKAAVLTSRRD